MSTLSDWKESTYNTGEYKREFTPQETFDAALGCKRPEPLPERKIDSLNDLLVAVWEARQRDLEVVSCDDPRARTIGFILGEECLVYISLTQIVQTKNGVRPEVAGLYDATSDPEGITRLISTPAARHFIATGKVVDDTDPVFGCLGEAPVDVTGSLKFLEATWIKEAEADKPVVGHVEMPQGLRGPIQLVAGEGTCEVERTA